LLDDELDRLPEKYRAPLVLCYLQGKSYVEAARLMGWRDGTVCGRLARARELLRQRLTHRGLTLSGTALVAALSEPSSAPAAMVAAVSRMAALFALGQTTAGAISPPVATLAQGVLQAMSMAKVKTIAALVAVFCVLVGGGGLAAHRLWSATESPPERAETPAAVAEAAEQPRKDSWARTDRYGDLLPAGAVARLGTLRFRHEGEAFSLFFSPDGKILASTCNDGLIFLWDSATGKELRRINTTPAKQEMSSHVSAIAFSPDGKTLASRDLYHVCVWDVATGKELRRIPVNSFVPKERGKLFFSPDGKILAFDLMAMVPPQKFQPRVMFLDAATGKERSHLDFKNGVRLHGFSPDGKAVAVTVGNDPEVQLWDVAAGKLIRKVKGGSMSLAFSPDGRLVASCASAFQIVLADVATGQEVGRLEAKMDFMMSLAFTPEGKTLLAGAQDGKVRIFDVATKTLRRQLDARMWMIRSMALSPDGRTVAAGTVYHTIRLWDVASGKELFEQYQGHDAQVNAVAFSPDGKILASGGDNQQIRLWNSADGTQLRLLKSSARTLTFSPDGKRIASLWRNNNTVRLWDVASGKEVLRLTHEGINTAEMDSLRCLAFSTDGRSVLTVDHRVGKPKPSLGTARLHVWDAASGRLVREFSMPELYPECLAIAPDGKSVALGGSNSALQIWDMEAGKLIAALPGHQHRVETVAFSPDGRTLASGSLDRTVRLWETATGKLIRTLHGHSRSVTALAFAPGGRWLASGSGAECYPYCGQGPHTIRVWDIFTGKEVYHFRGHDSNVLSLAFAADGSRLASGLRNSSVLIWDTAPLKRLTVASTKELAAAERDRLWAELATEDAASAYEAIGRLISTPTQAVALVKSRFQPVKAVDQQRIRERIADLDHDDFAVREAASRALERLGQQAEPALRRALAEHPSPEMRRRLEPLLASLSTVRSAEESQQVRAVQVLEHIGTPDAQRVLEKLAKGAPETRLMLEAKAAMQRLTSRPSPRR
jgi:WD40 repeat protein